MYAAVAAAAIQIPEKKTFLYQSIDNEIETKIPKKIRQTIADE